MGVQKAYGRAEPKRRALGEGAAQAAPTAPHATPHGNTGERSGPERFWARWPVRVALASSLVVSSVVHCSMVPLDGPHSFEMREVEGEAVIPVDVLTAGDLPAPPDPPPNSPSEPPASDKEKEPEPAPALRPEPPPRDAGAADAALDGSVDAALRDGAADAPSPFDGAVAHAPVGNDAGSGGPRDPEAIVEGDSVRADVALVTLVVNAEVIRTHPVGARMGYLLRAIPQWDDFMRGTDLDPVRDTDWLVISGPSLRNTARDVVLIHYSASDAIVDRAVRLVSSKYDRGGAFDAGVRGVRAVLAHADRAERVILRPEPHVLAVVPPSHAEKSARALVANPVMRHIHPGEAMYLRLVDPHHPMPEIPESITEMRMRVVPRPDEGADVFIEGDTKDGEEAALAADGIRRMVRRHNDALTSLLTHGLLDHVDVGIDGRRVKARVTATRDHIETLVTLVGDFLGVQPSAASAEPAPSSSPPHSASNPPQPR
jgi:hypothetical protein